jgi:hypothetical protein
MAVPRSGPTLLQSMQGALIGLLWGAELADRSRLAYHLGQALEDAVALGREGREPIALSPQLPLAEALAVTLPWALLSWEHEAYGSTFGRLVANHADRDLLQIWRRLLLQGLAGETTDGSFSLRRGNLWRMSEGLGAGLDLLDGVALYRHPLGACLDRIEGWVAAQTVSRSEASLIQALTIGTALTGQIALADRYSQQTTQRRTLEPSTRLLLLSLMGGQIGGHRLPDRSSQLGPLWLDAHRWGESLVKEWAGIGCPAGPVVTSGIQAIRL